MIKVAQLLVGLALLGVWVSLASAAPPRWVGEAIEIALEIESREFFRSTALTERLEREVREATGPERLRVLERVVWFFEQAVDHERFEKYSVLFREEAKRLGSPKGDRLEPVFQAIGKMKSGGVDAVVARLDEVLTEGKLSDIEAARVLAVRADLLVLHKRVDEAVDDIDVNIKILEERLESWGMSVSSASSAQEAEDKLRAAATDGRPFDLVLTDFQMPERDGADLARSIAGDPVLLHTKVIVLSSVDGPVCTAAFRGVPTQSILTKPVRSNLLRVEIKRASGAVDAEDRAREARPTSEPAATSSGSAGQKLRVLVAEDNVVNQKIVAHMVDPDRYELVFADNCREACAAFEAERFDLVLMDVSMPEMDGLEATKAIRSFEAREQRGEPTPIVALTAYAMSGDRERFLSAGMNDYLTKPIRRKVLAETVVRWTDRAALQSPA